MTVRSIPRYPEVREDGSMWVPLAPPPAPTYRQVSGEDRGIVGQRAVVSYSTEWLMDLRVMTDPFRDAQTPGAEWVVELCDEGAWYAWQMRSVEPRSSDLILSAVGLVFVLSEGPVTPNVRRPRS